MSLKEFDREEYDRNRREEGIEEGRILTARAMLTRHLDIALIADCTGLTADEVAALGKE